MPNEPVTLSGGLWTVALVLWGVLVVGRGRLELATAVFLATSNWAYSATIGPDIPLFRILFLSVVGALAVYLWRERPAPGRGAWLAPWASPAYGWFAVWVGWLVVVSLLYSRPETTGQLTFLLAYGFFAFVAVAPFAGHTGKYLHFAIAYVSTSLAVGAIALRDLSALIDRSPFGDTPLMRGLTGVNYITFSFPYLATTTFLLVGALAGQRQLLRAVCSVGAVFSAYVLASTGARQTVVGTGVAATCVTWWYLRRKRIPFVGAVLIVVALAGIVVGAYAGLDVWSRWMDPEVFETGAGRSEMWRSALETFLDAPVAGKGVAYAVEGDWAHNSLLDVAASQGAIGVCLFLGWLAIVLQGSLRRLRSLTDPSAWALHAATLGILLGALVAGLVNSVLSMPHFFWSAAVIHAVSRQGQTSALVPAARSNPTRRWGGLPRRARRFRGER